MMNSISKSNPKTEKVMKKSFLLMGLAAAALSFTNCNKQEVEIPAAGDPFAIQLTSVEETRTANDGMATKWVEGDALSVFYATAGSTSYSANNQFTVTNAEANLATADITLAEGTYDWYLMYPYDSHITTPANEDGYLAIGSKSNAAQTQTGLNNMEHLAGANIPLWGTAKNVASTDVPTVEMHQIASVIEVNVTNTLSKPINVLSIAFTGTEDIVGTYYINISGNTPALVPSGDKFVSKTATLSVEGADAIPAGNTASFYLAIKPFTAPAAGELGISVVAEEGAYEKTLKLSSATTFAAGHIKTVNVGFETAGDFDTVAQVLSKGEGEGYNLGNVLVYAVNGKSVILGDATAKILLYMENHGLAVGDRINLLNATAGIFHEALQMTSGTITVLSNGNTVNHGTPVDLNDENAASNLVSTFQGSGYHSAVYVSMTGFQDGRYIENDNTELYMVSANNATDQKDVDATGYVYNYYVSSVAGSFSTVICDVAVAENGRTVTPSEQSLTWTSATDMTPKSFTVTTTLPSTNGFTVSPASLTYFDYSVSGNTVTVTPKGTITANQQEVLTLTHTGNEKIKATVALNRKASTTVVDALTRSFLGIPVTTTYAAFEGVGGQSGAVYAGICAGGKDVGTNGAIQLRTKNSNEGIVTTASGGKVKKIVVKWNSTTTSGRTLDIYGKTSAYTAATDLYNTSKQGTKLGSIKYGTSTELTVSGNYTFIGLRSNSSAMYIDEIDITWE